jgi:gluconate:H+ symporter, GntP family
MGSSFLYPLICLLAGIGIIILLTAKYKVHAFFALLLACFITGFGLGLPVDRMITDIKNGFGNVMKSLGVIIVLGTALGTILEFNGSTGVMAAHILKKTGEKRAALAMSLTGLIVGLPIFCDSAYIVLNGINRPLSRKTGFTMATICGSLATGLLAVHCLVPPHPGVTAAAGDFGVDLGKLILVGIGVAIPGALVGHWWSLRAGKIFRDLHVQGEGVQTQAVEGPRPLLAFLPILVPVVLIATRSFLGLGEGSGLYLRTFLLAVGDPVIALSIGVLLALFSTQQWDRVKLASMLEESAGKAGSILVIIGAGGAFGSVLNAGDLGKHLHEFRGIGTMGIFFPFLVTFLLKTAQGSSTVAIITAAPIVLPFLQELGLNSPDGKLLAVLSMGAGSMMISHANDAYFWVISRFSGLDMKTMLRLYSVATILMALTTLSVLYILTLWH